jgi:hypothetical protein
MNPRSKTGLDILKVALGIGVLADVLLRQMPWGLNVLLFNLAFVAGTITLLWRRKPEYLTAQTWALLGAQIFFAAMFVWRDSSELHFADSVAIVAIMSVLFVPQLKISPRVAGVFHYAIGFLWSTLNSAFAPFVLLVSDIKWNGADRTGWSRNVIAVVRGLLIVAPLVFIFGALFVAADAAYEGLVNRVLNFDPAIIFSHALLMAVFAWASAGYLRGLTLGIEPNINVVNVQADDRTASSASGVEASADSKVDAMRSEVAESTGLPDNASILEHINRSDPPNDNAENQSSEQPKSDAKTASKTWTWANIDNSILPSVFSLGTVEIGIIFGLMDLLFVSFVIVQVPYLFGGMDLVQNTPDFKLAEYARRGFGELVAVAALVLPILLISHWLVRKESPLTEKLFRVLAGVQIVLLFVIMASAVQRLVILTGPLGYGMTTIRLYPMIFMTWLAIVFVWFALSVLRGYRQYFAWVALWSAFVVLGATHFLNPDAFIVRTNVALMQQGREFDAFYNSRLSDDAIPVLIDSFHSLGEADQETILKELIERYCQKQENFDLRTWNLTRSNASKSLEEVALAAGTLGGCADGHAARFRPFRIYD